MSRITGTDAFNMMEAYNAIYAPQELTEEQVWEEVEAWVNSLVEEGYDLSEYTWEDMYEEYLSEIPTSTQMGGKPTPAARPQPRVMTAFDAGGGNARVRELMRQGIGGVEANRRVSTTGEYLQRQAATRADASRNRFPTGLTDRTPRSNSPTRPTAQQSGMYGRYSEPTQFITRPAAAPARPAAAPARPAAAPARPAAAPTGGLARPTTTATTAPAATPAAPRQRDTSITDMIGRSQIRQGVPINTGNVSSDIRSRALRGTDVGGAGGSVATPVVTARPSVQQQIRQRRLNMDLDLFDIVRGYLIDEGYAETEEAASVIMANMSEEWKESILESGYFPTRESQMKDEAKYRLGGQTVKPRTAQNQAKPTPSNLK